MSVLYYLNNCLQVHMNLNTRLNHDGEGEQKCYTISVCHFLMMKG